MEADTIIEDLTPDGVELKIAYEVTFDGTDDEEDVRRLSLLHKWAIAIIISTVSLFVTWLSSCWSLASDNIIAHFGINHELSVLGISFYIWALGTGGIFLAPISEYYGRKLTYTFGLFLTIIFNFLPEFCNNYGGVLFGRFMSGFFAASFMAVASGTFSDIFAKEELAYPMALYTMSPFVGPGIGPLVGGFVNTYLDYKWTFHIMAILGGVCLASVVIFIPETYQPVLLKRKAQRLRKTTGDDNYYAPIERQDSSLLNTVVLSCKRPVGLFFRDKMTSILCFYTGFVMSIVYMFFVAMPYLFTTVYGFELYQVGLSFLGLIVGMAMASFSSPPLTKRVMARQVANGNNEPESRFFSLKVGVFICPMGLFIMAWTAYSHVHWIAPIIGSGIYAFGVIYVFNGIFGYTVDAYRLYAASAMATNSFVRSLMAGIFPLFGLQMYKALNVHWASTLLAIFACTLIPVAFLLEKYGPKLRKSSLYAWA